MSLDRAGLAEHRLGIARRILQRVTLADDFHLYTSAFLDSQGIAQNRHWNMVRALSSPSNALFLASDAAWTDVWLAIHVGPAAFLKEGVHTSWLTGAARAQMGSRLQLVRRESNGQYSRVGVLDAHLAARMPESIRPAYTAEAFGMDTTVESAVEWLGIAHHTARTSGKTPQEPLTLRDRATEIPIADAHSFSPSAFGGRAPYSFAIIEQPTPAVFVQNATTKAITLTLPAADYSVGDSFEAVVEVTDANMKKATGIVTITAKAADTSSGS